MPETGNLLERIVKEAQAVLSSPAKYACLLALPFLPGYGKSSELAQQKQITLPAQALEENTIDFLCYQDAAPQDPAKRKLIEAAVQSLKTATPKQAAAIAAILDRWYPNTPEFKPFIGGETEELDKDSRAALGKLSGIVADYASQQLRANRPYTAGFEAYRALGIDAGNARAAGILMYTKGRPKRESELQKQGLVKSEYGWLPKELMKIRKPDCVPEGKEWIDAKKTDEAHSQWKSARKLQFTYVTLTTNLPISEGAKIGARMDWFLEWLRARLCRINDYQELTAPVELRVTAKSAEYNKQVPGTSSGGWTGTEYSIVDAEMCGSGSVIVAQHECAHYFLFRTLPWRARHGNWEPYVWMQEAFPAYCYFASPESPVDGGNYWKARRAYYPSLSKELDKVANGENVLGELISTPFDSYNESHQAQQYVAGSVMAMYALEHPDICEKYMRFLADVYTGNAKKDAFETYFGSPADFSKKMAAWLKTLPTE